LEKLKLKEGRKSFLKVPKKALVKASRIQDKVKGVGFGKNRIRFGISARRVGGVASSTLEIRIKLSPNLETFFSMINYVRFLNVNPERCTKTPTTSCHGRAVLTHNTQI
jgi:XTP/dITP diphosphohydrolase